MSADLSSPDDDDDDEDEDIIITLLLLAACDLSISKKALFHESLTVDDIRRRSGKIRHHALQHQLASPFWTLFNSKHDDALITLCGFDHASFELLQQRFKPYFDSFFTPLEKKEFQEFNKRNPVDPDCCVPSVVWHLGWHVQELADPI